MGRVRVPGSKSVTNRALVLGALAQGESLLRHPLDADDTRALGTALEQLGARVKFEDRVIRVSGPLAPPASEVHLDLGPAGTPARFLVALLAALPGTFVLDGSARLRERPMGPLVEALRAQGASIESLGREGFLPLRIHGGTLRGGEVTIRGDVSSQFLSALLLVSPLVPGGLSLNVTGSLSSASYVTLTRQAIDAFTRDGRLVGTDYEVPGDDSAACFFLAGAVASAGVVLLDGLLEDSDQPDSVFREWAISAGGFVRFEGGTLVAGREPSVPLRAVVADVDAAPDAALPLAAMQAFAHGVSRLENARRLREKESDRLAAARDLLDRAGAVTREEDGPALVIDGEQGVPRAGHFVSHADHRVVMSAAVLALGLPEGSVVEGAEDVAKSYPRFFDDFEPLVERA